MQPGMFDVPASAPAQRVLSVSELNRLTRELVERHLPLMWVGGEISNLKRYGSGHCYFTLKDDAAQIDCVMFRTKLMLLGWQPRDGMQVEVRACPTLYEARGKFQLNVEVMRQAGLGALYEAFARLKARLEREGLFAADRKRPLPRFPRRVGVVTSPKAAALRDVLTTLGRRMPSVEVVIYPTPVQGEGAAARIAYAIRVACQRAECDVLIVCRGGGSIEDLWAYNDEKLARAIAASRIPVVSGVGHETDFTIADFVADARAPTPTAAAQLVSCDRVELCDQLRHTERRLLRTIVRALENRIQRVDLLAKSLVHPGDRIGSQLQHLTHLANRLCGGWKRYSDAQTWALEALLHELERTRPDLASLERRRMDCAKRLSAAARTRLQFASDRVASIDTHLEHLNPERVLDRGYSIASDASGAIVRDAASLSLGEELDVKFARGSVRSVVKQVRSEN